MPVMMRRFSALRLDRAGPTTSRAASWRRHELLVRAVPSLGAWRDQWDALVLEATLPSPFLRSWWLEHTAQASPCFVLVFDDGELIGGMAFDEDEVLGVPRFRVLGHGSLVPDHLDAVLKSDRRADAIDALAAWCRRPGSRIFDLSGVVSGSSFLEILPGPLVVQQLEQCYYRRLPDDPDLVVRQMSGTERSSVKRGRKKLAKFGARYRRIPPSETEAALARLRELHDRRWGAESAFLEVFEPFAAAAREGMARDEVRFHEFAIDDRVVGVLVDFHLAGRAFTFQDGRDPDPSLPSVGNVLQAHAMEDACRGGTLEYDFLSGSTPYKRGFTDRSRPVMRMRAAKGAGAAAILALMAAREHAGEIKGRSRRALAARREQPGAAVGRVRGRLTGKAGT